MQKITFVILIAFTLLVPSYVVAQSLPVDASPIQRTIEEEGAQTFSEPVSNASKSSNKPLLYGFLAIGLGLVAAGAMFILWKNSTPSKK